MEPCDERTGIGEGKSLMLILAFIFVFSCLVFIVVKAFAEDEKLSYVGDGCYVKFENNMATVVNPDDCKDKQFVKYLNCYEVDTLPLADKPKECQDGIH